jgi:putative intracellular protease/amidase
LENKTMTRVHKRIRTPFGNRLSFCFRRSFLCLALVAVGLFVTVGPGGYGRASVAGRNDGAARRVLLLADDSCGANWNIEDDKSSLSEAFLSFGWKLDLASVRGEVASCEFARQATGVKNLKMDLLVSDVGSVEDYDAVIVLPGQSHESLVADPNTLDLVREADRKGVVIAGFCRGVRLLAAAGVVRGRRVTGHPDYAAEYEAAGAHYLGFKDLEKKSDAPPPVVDGNLVTVVRSKFYREEACEAIRGAVERAAGARRREDVFGCTIVMAARNGLVLAGNNEDRNHPQTIVTFIPAKGSFYGRVVFGYDDAPVQGGMNDQGLFIDGNALAPTGWKPDPEKPVFRGNVMMTILATCATCGDVEDFFSRSNFPALERARFPVADRTGASIVVEYGQGKVQFVKSGTWYQIATNFVMSNIRDENYPCWRYRAADKILSEAGELSLDLVRNALEKTRQEGRALTVYSNIYDLKKGSVTTYLLRNFEEAVVLDLAEELKKGQRRIELASLFKAGR